MSFDGEAWQRTVFEALRPIDPDALFNVGVAEVDFRQIGDNQPEDFPAADLVEFMDRWLAELDPDDSEARTEWEGGGVRLVIRAIGRGSRWRGATGIPSFNMLEPKLGHLHFTDGEERRLIDLTLDEVDELASGQRRLVGQGASYQDTFSGIAHEMRHLNAKTVAELHPAGVQAYAGMMGLGPSLPGMGNYDATWRAMNRMPPDH